MRRGSGPSPALPQLGKEGDEAGTGTQTQSTLRRPFTKGFLGSNWTRWVVPRSLVKADSGMFWACLVPGLARRPLFAVSGSLGKGCPKARLGSLRLKSLLFLSERSWLVCLGTGKSRAGADLQCPQHVLRSPQQFCPIFWNVLGEYC